jgi:uncharacterized membrane protein
MIAGMTFYQICLYFLLYSFLGWVVEVIYHAVHLGKIVNRGFLCGPVCPVYGFGMLAVLAAGNGLNLLLAGRASSGAANLGTGWLFLLGMLLTTAIELIAGWALDRIFHARWWDYSGKPLNFHGYICLEFSIYWGIGVVLVVKVLHRDLAEHTAQMIPPRIGWPVMAVLYAVYLIDFIITVLSVLRMNRRLGELEEIRQKLRIPADRLSTFVGENSLETVQKLQHAQVQANLGRLELGNALNAYTDEQLLRLRGSLNLYTDEQKQNLLERARKLRNALRAHRHFGPVRLLRAFPGLRHEQFADLIEALKKADPNWKDD